MKKDNSTAFYPTLEYLILCLRVQFHRSQRLMLPLLLMSLTRVSLPCWRCSLAVCVVLGVDRLCKKQSTLVTRSVDPLGGGHTLDNRCPGKTMRKYSASRRKLCSTQSRQTTQLLSAPLSRVTLIIFSYGFFVQAALNDSFASKV
jgi:hypothetical protein